jgi:hypothetical protein
LNVTDAQEVMQQQVKAQRQMMLQHLPFSRQNSWLRRLRKKNGKLQ